MANSYQRTLLAAVLSLASVIGCENAANFSSVAEPPALSVAALVPKDVKVVTRLFNGPGGIAVSDYVTKSQTATLEVGQYRLVVPRNAVRKPTRFVMIVLDNKMVGVKLFAYDQEWKPVTQFQRPVQLTLPYDEADLSARGPQDRLYIANVVSESDATILDVVAARADDRSQTVSGDLYHFSVWSLALQFTKEFSPAID